jgi:hypothetical protein
VFQFAWLLKQRGLVSKRSFSHCSWQELVAPRNSKPEANLRGGSSAGKYTECAESDDRLQNTPMMKFGTAEDRSSW